MERKDAAFQAAWRPAKKLLTEEHEGWREVEDEALVPVERGAETLGCSVGGVACRG